MVDNLQRDMGLHHNSCESKQRTETLGQMMTTTKRLGLGGQRRMEKLRLTKQLSC